MDVGQRIKRVRKERGLTQKQLGEMLNTSQQMIALYESGKHAPTISTLTRIANALQVNTKALIGNKITNVFSGVTPDNAYMQDASLIEQILEELEQNKASGISDIEDIYLLQDFRKLNILGKKEARKRVQELTEIKRYTDPDTPPAE